MFDTEIDHLPSYTNWLEEGAVSVPQDQSTCGASWALTSSSVLESLAVINGKSMR